MKALIENVQYVTGAPNADGDDGTAFIRTPLFVAQINFKQVDLVADGGNWGDEDVRLEVQRKLNADPRYEGIIFDVEFPPKPVFPATPEEAVAPTPSEQPPAPSPEEPPAP